MFNKQDEVSRRQFMLHSARTLLGVSAAPMLGATLATPTYGFQPTRANAAKSVIFLNMNGGMSHIDTFDPKPKKKDVSPIEALETTAEDIFVSKFLPLMAKQMDKVAVINSMNTTQGAHEQGQYFLHRSYHRRGTIVHPALGAWVMRLAGKHNPTIPGFVSIGGTADSVSPGFMGSKFAGVPIRDAHSGLQDSKRPGSISKTDFEKRLGLADKMNAKFHKNFAQGQIKDHQTLYKDALRLMNSEDLKAFDITSESKKTKDLYGDHSFGQGCLLARRLVEHNVRFVEVTLGGWDTHYDNFAGVEARCEVLDKAMSALLSDLHRRGMLEDTVVALGTEFGRTPKIVKEHQDGRDHYPQAFTCLLAGGGIQGGQRYGKTDPKGAKVAERMVGMPDFNATIAHALGLPTEQVIMSPSGRPFSVADKGQPILDLF